MDIDLLKARKGDYEKVFSTDEGKRVLADLYEFTMMNKPRYNPNQDAEKHLYFEGMARVGYRIKSILKQSPDQIDKIMETNNYMANYDPFKRKHGVR